MRCALLGLFGLIAAALAAAAPAGAGYYQFSGKVEVLENDGCCAHFFFGGDSTSGSGVGSSSVVPTNEIGGFGGVNGFTDVVTDTYMATGGSPFLRTVAFSGIGDAGFTKASKGLHGKMAVAGYLHASMSGVDAVSFAFTANGTKGLGLAGTVPANGFSKTNSIRFGTWTTGKVTATDGFTKKLTAKGFDLRTPAGQGQVQFVTPVVAQVAPGLPSGRGAIVALTLTFVPEPGRAVLLLAGCFAVASLGVRRTRSRITA